MNTRSAIEAMLKGNKVRLKEWHKTRYIMFTDDMGFVDNDLHIMYIEVSDDWKIYEEPKQTVTLEKWFCKNDIEYFEISTSNIDEYCQKYNYEKIKLLDTYEVEL